SGKILGRDGCPDRAALVGWLGIGLATTMSHRERMRRIRVSIDVICIYDDESVRGLGMPLSWRVLTASPHCGMATRVFRQVETLSLPDESVRGLGMPLSWRVLTASPHCGMATRVFRQCNIRNDAMFNVCKSNRGLGEGNTGLTIVNWMPFERGSNDLRFGAVLSFDQKNPKTDWINHSKTFALCGKSSLTDWQLLKAKATEVQAIQGHTAKRDKYDRLQANRTRNCVYKIKCSDCIKVYIGQTARELHIRIGEHKRKINKPLRNADEYRALPKDSTIVEHALDMEHKIDLENVEVLRRGLRSTSQRLMAEARCPFSPFVFNFVIDEIMRRTLEGLQNRGVQIACDENLVDLEYADDIVLIFEEEEKAHVFFDELTKVIPSFDSVVVSLKQRMANDPLFDIESSCEKAFSEPRTIRVSLITDPCRAKTSKFPNSLLGYFGNQFTLYRGSIVLVTLAKVKDEETPVL
ncbi:hypothetical protein CLF_110644, partial [Clonorchis sinensis]